MACDTNALSRAASCFQCLDSKQTAEVQAYLLAVIAGASTDPETLLAAATQFQALSEKELMMVQAYLLCKINGG
jgi:stage V sporulation protein SpoVS